MSSAQILYLTHRHRPKGFYKIEKQKKEINSFLFFIAKEETLYTPIFLIE
jgi:hypothetical protein